MTKDGGVAGYVVAGVLWTIERINRFVGVGEKGLELLIDIATLVSIVIAIIVGVQKIQKNRRDELERRAARESERSSNQHQV